MVEVVLIKMASTGHIFKCLIMKDNCLKELEGLVGVALVEVVCN